MSAPRKPRRVLNIADVTAKVGLSKMHVYRLMKRGEFPRPIHLTPTRRGWIEDEVDAWIEARIDARDSAAG